jgi:dienelactone hydrolase
LCAEVDQSFPTDTDRKQAQELLEKRGIKAVFHDYPGTEHGFAVRGDESVPIVYAGKVKALEDTIAFFKAEL